MSVPGSINSLRQRCIWKIRNRVRLPVIARRSISLRQGFNQKTNVPSEQGLWSVALQLSRAGRGPRELELFLQAPGHPGPPGPQITTPHPHPGRSSQERANRIKPRRDILCLFKINGCSPACPSIHLLFQKSLCLWISPAEVIFLTICMGNFPHLFNKKIALGPKEP